MSFEPRELALYLAAAVVYITVSVLVPEFMLSFIEGAVFLAIAVWLVPALVRRMRQRR